MSIEHIRVRLDQEFKIAPFIGIPKHFRGLFVCDSHWGRGDSADDFMSVEPDFNYLLDSHWKDGFTLIIGGDLLDLAESDYHAIMEAHPFAWGLVQRYKEADRVIWLPGNHDPNPTLPRMVKMQYPDGKMICATHGDIGDWVCEHHGAVARAFVRYIWAGIGQRVLGLPDPTSAIALKNPMKHLEVRRAYNEWGLAQKPNFTLCYGHVHYSEELGGGNSGRVFNGGCFMGQHKDSIEIVEQMIHFT